MSDPALATDGILGALVALVEATPPPPEGEPDDLLAAFDVMVAARAALLGRLGGVEVPGLTADGRALVDELGRRDRAWLSALARAQDVVGDRLRAVRRAQRAAL